MMTFSKQSEGMPMQTINLKQYYPFCKEDIFVEVSDEIVEAFLLDKRAEAARDHIKLQAPAAYCLPGGFISQKWGLAKRLIW